MRPRTVLPTIMSAAMQPNPQPPCTISCIDNYAERYEYLYCVERLATLCRNVQILLVIKGSMPTLLQMPWRLHFTYHSQSAPELLQLLADVAIITPLWEMQSVNLGSKDLRHVTLLSGLSAYIFSSAEPALCLS
jgi:hypothetical protein